MRDKESRRKTPETDAPAWTFLTNHAHVLICLARDPELVLREVALLVGITERAVQRIVADLEEGGYLERSKEGRRNTYRLTLTKKLRHPVEGNCHVRDLVELIK
jgi:DNA-binding MarR family transcriptional regulator